MNDMIKIEVSAKSGKLWIGQLTQSGMEFLAPSRRNSRSLQTFQAGPGVYRHIPGAVVAGSMRRDTGYIEITATLEVREISAAEAAALVAGPVDVTPATAPAPRVRCLPSRRTGCRCGSLEDVTSATDCAACRQDF